MDNELVYVLHTRKYRETSQLVDLLGRNAGRLRVVARGSRAKARGKRPSTMALQPFQPFFASWRGKSDLKSLRGHEPAGSVISLQGDALYIGFYVNELLTRLLPEGIAHAPLFDRYARLITLLAHGVDVEAHLRIFELSFLDDMGYGLDLYTDHADGSPIDSSCDYLFHPGEGFTRIEISPTSPQRNMFCGAHLLAIAEQEFDSPMVRKSAKRLLRQALEAHLGQRPLHSRELFKKMIDVSGAPS